MEERIQELVSQRRGDPKPSDAAGASSSAAANPYAGLYEEGMYDDYLEELAMYGGRRWVACAPCCAQHIGLAFHSLLQRAMGTM